MLKLNLNYILKKFIKVKSIMNETYLTQYLCAYIMRIMYVYNYTCQYTCHGYEARSIPRYRVRIVCVYSTVLYLRSSREVDSFFDDDNDNDNDKRTGKFDVLFIII